MQSVLFVLPAHSIGGRTITNLRFADDIDSLAEEEEELAKLVECLDKASTAYCMEISAEKTKLMTNNTGGINTVINVNGQKLETVTIVKNRKLQSYGHVSRSSGLAKTILQGTVKGGRRQGRQRKRWEGNTREWTGLEFAKSQRAMENRGKWRKLAVKHQWCPNDPRG